MPNVMPNAHQSTPRKSGGSGLAGGAEEDPELEAFPAGVVELVVDGVLAPLDGVAAADGGGDF